MGRKKNPNNNYFNQQVENAVCTYISAETQREREAAFSIIYPAFSKIAEVMFHKVKFSYSDDDMQDIMAECVAHMTEKLPKFTCGIGTKAFSYFTVCARFYYIQLSNKNYKYFQRTIPISSMEENWDIENTDRKDSNSAIKAELFYAFLQYCELNFDKLFIKKTQTKLARVLLDTLNNFEMFEELKRRPILKYVHEQVSNKEKDRVYLTKISTILATHFTLFRERWESGNTSLEFCSKTKLNVEEKEYIKKYIVPGKQNNGCVAVAKKFGVDTKVVIDYVKTI